MPKIYGQDTLNVGGTKVLIRQVLLKGSSTLLPIVSDVVASARGWIAAVLPELRTGAVFEVRRAFDSCFILPPDTAAAMNTVRTVLSTVGGFIGRELALKIVDEDDHGYVNRYYGGRIHMVGGVVQYDADDDPIARRGEIHINATTVRDNPVLATITLIHEASHKFSNLRDHGDRGYFHDDLSGYWTPGLTWQEALLNADSYAVFVYKVMAAKYHSVMVHGRSLT
jgi:hypothetical protein